MPELIAQVVPGVRSVDREEWERLDAGGSPFHDWSYLEAVEAASAVPEEGFAPAHVLLREGGRLVAACPLYVKGDGRAEFIYDWSWHALAARFGVDYYPKAVAMCPVTPAVATRFLVEPGRDRAPLERLLAQCAERWAREAGLSGLHWLFTTEEDSALLESLGYLRRETAQLRMDCGRWSSFEDYLGSFRARHRKAIRRERRRVVEQGLRIEVLDGELAEESHRDALFAFYRSTCLEHGTGSDYLKRESWERLFETWRERLLLCLARDQRGELVAGSLSVKGGGDLYGRYWGCRGEWPGLYFELTCYAPLEAAIARGLQRFWAGFGNAAHKHARGFEPARTLSAHRVFDQTLHQALEDTLERERALVGEGLEAARAHSRLIR